MSEFFFIGDTHVGKLHSENQDRIVKRELYVPSSNEKIYLIGVADGISQCSYGASVARWLTEKHLASDTIFKVGGETVAVELRLYLEKLYTQFQEEFADFEDMLASGASLSIACATGFYAHCFWAGDSPIYYTKKKAFGYETVQVSLPDTDLNGLLTDCFGANSPFRLKYQRLDMAKDFILTITSDGVKLDASLLNNFFERFGFTERVTKEVMKVSLSIPRADDVSLVALKAL